jgi:hypothetical protein
MPEWSAAVVGGITWHGLKNADEDVPFTTMRERLKERCENYS